MGTPPKSPVGWQGLAQVLVQLVHAWAMPLQEPAPGQALVPGQAQQRGQLPPRQPLTSLGG